VAAVSARRKYRVLVVDDEWLIADTTAMVLGEGGYDVVGPVGSVRGALALLTREHVDAALLDIRLGDEDSFAVAADLVCRGIAFAFVTGFSRVEVPAAYAGIRIINKPASTSQLVEAVATLLPAS
jgi:CheY-like chemotaxis protein